MKILYSKKALVGPYEKGEGFMFRVINAKNNDLIDVEVSLTLSMLDKKQKRSFHRLALERKSISSFPLSWTVVHPITEESPLYNLTAKDLEKGNAEFLINVSATDMELAKEMHSRFSYLYNEIIFGAKFAYIIEHEPDGTVVVDPKRIHEIEIV
jgi:inward rectifier potassium channel